LQRLWISAQKNFQERGVTKTKSEKQQKIPENSTNKPLLEGGQ